MSDNKSRSRTTFHAVDKRPSPNLLRIFCADTGIDDDPAALVFEQPQIDMAERERQWHAQPLDPGRHLHDGAGIGSLGKCVAYFFFRLGGEHPPILRGFPHHRHEIAKPARNFAAYLFGRFFLDRPVTTYLHDERDDFTCFIEVSGVDAAAANGYELPFSCKGGVCATCRTHVSEGEVKMETNYGLEPWEVEKGYVLACQSHPVSESVVLDYDKT